MTWVDGERTSFIFAPILMLVSSIKRKIKRENFQPNSKEELIKVVKEETQEKWDVKEVG